jgi:putative sugar O-methyltransferase
VIGAGGNYDHMLAYNSGFMGQAFVRAMWTLNRDRYLTLGEPIGSVHQPIIGHPAGIYVKGALIPINSFRDCFRALEISRILHDKPAATVVEIGGGVGWQGYQIMRLSSPPVAKYIDYDIPEVLAIASYIALHSMPERRVGLYGEDGDYDVAMYPHFAIADMPEADMVFNQNSFSEMDGETARAYLRMVEHRCVGYFRHINHEKRFVYRQPDGSVSLNAIGSEMVPSGFQLLTKSSNVFHSPDDIGYVSWEYLYRRAT